MTFDNNNESMATVVETFYVQETTNLIHDQDSLDKWNAKVEELGLEGQKKVLVVKDKSPIPFLWMNNAIINAFKTLCPTACKIEEYDKTPIPVELLETVGLCKNEGYFDKIEIWYNERDKDPVIVGFSFNNSKNSDWEKEWYGKKYLIGRWADVKASLDALVDRAKKLFIQQTISNAKAQIKQCQRAIEDAETNADREFGFAMPTTKLDVYLPF